MSSNFPSKQAAKGHSPYKLLLSVGLPVLLLLGFLSSQFINVDSIGWHNGFSHPLAGWDHLVTMLAVGIWAAQLRGQAVWMLPLAFVSVMSLGGIAGAAGLEIPSIEGIILLSCAVFSVLITKKVRFGAKINVLIVAFFAFFHGFAHGQEISTSASLISYTLGFMLATLLLHGAGILLAKLVLLAITCLLTVVFSNTALAKAAEANLNNKLIAVELAQASDFTHLKRFQNIQFPAGFALAYMTNGERKLPAHDISAPDSGGGGYSGVACKLAHQGGVNPYLTLKSYQQTQANFAALVLKQAVFEALELSKSLWLFDSDYIRHSSLDFKYYYRDINHTPGKHLLSNGVGLTSPPLLINAVLAPQVYSPHPSTPISTVEAPCLQLIIAQRPVGNLDIQTSKSCLSHSQYFSFADQCRQVQPVSHLASVCRPDCRTYNDVKPVFTLFAKGHKVIHSLAMPDFQHNSSTTHKPIGTSFLRYALFNRRPYASHT